MKLPHGWTSRRFDQLGELCSGSTPSSSRTEFWDGATVWVTPTDLSRLNTPYLHDSAKHITERGLRNCSARLLPPGSIVLSSRAPIGYVAIPTVPFCTNQGCKSIELHDSYHSEFVYYAVTAAVPRLKRLGEGTTFAEISKSSLGRAEVVLPIDRAEQAKIAEVLSTVDRAIEQTEALIAKQQRIKTGLMQDLLTRGIDEHGNLRSEQTHKFKDSPLGRIPAEWDVTKIGDQFVERKERGRTGLPVMSIVMNVGLVKRSLVDRRVETALTPEQHALVCEGDIAYNMMRMWQGVLGRSSSDCLVSPAYVVLRPLESIDSRFAQWLFRDLRTIHAFCKASKGVVDDRLRLYPKDIFPIPIAMPKCLDEHSLIADRLDAQHRAIESFVRGLEKLHFLKRGLMQDLLTGNHRVTALLEPSGVTA